MCMCVHVFVHCTHFYPSDFWDTAGQERFNSMHSSYYHQAHACILVSLLPNDTKPYCPCQWATKVGGESSHGTKELFNQLPFPQMYNVYIYIYIIICRCAWVYTGMASLGLGLVEPSLVNCHVHKSSRLDSIVCVTRNSQLKGCSRFATLIGLVQTFIIKPWRM